MCCSHTGPKFPAPTSGCSKPPITPAPRYPHISAQRHIYKKKVKYFKDKIACFSHVWILDSRHYTCTAAMKAEAKLPKTAKETGGGCKDRIVSVGENAHLHENSFI